MGINLKDGLQQSLRNGPDDRRIAVTERESVVNPSATAVYINIPNTTLVPGGTVIYTVTPSTVLHITSFLFTQLNQGVQLGEWTLNDDTTVKSTFLTAERISGASSSMFQINSPHMPEPLQFSTNISLVEVLGDLQVSGFIIGYEI